jgi:hypothetical protein
VTELAGAPSPTNTNSLNISEIKFFGTPGPTTLDKGSLTLGRSLDVPRISRYDVDTETPRPEKLVVDYDTTVNSSPTDISGQGNHGTFYGATYSPADKAFKFDGTDDVIYNGGIGNWTDNISHTFSFWFKCESVNASNYGGSLVNLYNTTSTVNHYSAFSFSTGSSGVISFYHFGNDFTYNYPFELNRWYHVAGVYSGSSTTQKVYVDGVDLGPGTAAPGSDTSGLLLGTNPKLSLGGDFGRSDYYFDGQISNFKLYNVALEPSEVQKLYRLGRTGRSMVISDTAVGIGKVPEAQLDVRGVIRAEYFKPGNPIAFFAYNSGTTNLEPSDNSTVIWPGTAYNYNNVYDTSTGLFTAPIDGIYLLTATMRVKTADLGTSYFDIFHNSDRISRVETARAENDTDPGTDHINATVTYRASLGDTFHVQVRLNMRADVGKIDNFTGVLIIPL